MKILALDLGTKTGFAKLENGVVISGTWVLLTTEEQRLQKEKGLDRCCDVRASRLLAWIVGENLQPGDYIYFEDVTFGTSQYQTQLWGSLRGIVTLQHPRCNIRAVPVGTLKKYATGSGAAKKEQMAECLLAKTGIPPEGKDDNEVDALHLLRFARSELKI